MPDSPSSRRNFLSSLTKWGALAAGTAGLTQLGRIVISFLYPNKTRRDWLFVTAVNALKEGQSTGYTTPTGQSVLISRIGNTGKASDFLALSDVCPHLGCKVYWESKTTSFFCPCHNGRFDSRGLPLEGPPAKANQELIQFPLKVSSGLLYIQVSSESLVRLSFLRKKHGSCSHSHHRGPMA